MIEDTPLPPLSKRRQIQIARYRIEMNRHEMEMRLKELDRIKVYLLSTIDGIKQSLEGYLQALDELEALTPKKTRKRK